MSLINPFVQRRDRVENKGNKKKKVGIYASQFYFDSVNRLFIEKQMPDYAIPEDEFNSKFYCRYIDPEDRDAHDPAALIKSMKSAEVHGRIWEPDNPAHIVERDGLRLVNVKQNYYDAVIKKRRNKKAA